MPQTQVGASRGPLARLPGWLRQNPAAGPAALDPSTTPAFPMAQAEDGSPTARHAARPVPAQGTRTLRPTTLLLALDGDAGIPVSRGLIGRQGRTYRCALASLPGTP